jgi:hypothetical protein
MNLQEYVDCFFELGEGLSDGLTFYELLDGKGNIMLAFPIESGDLSMEPYITILNQVALFRKSQSVNLRVIVSLPSHFPFIQTLDNEMYYIFITFSFSP